MVDPHTRDPRGFGFVTFRHIEDAEDAIDALDGKYELMGRIIRGQKVIIIENKRKKITKSKFLFCLTYTYIHTYF